MNFKATQIYGDAYRTDRALNNAKTHVIQFDENGDPLQVLCKRVKLEHCCAADNSGMEEPIENADCETCLRRLKKLQG